MKKHILASLLLVLTAACVAPAPTGKVVDRACADCGTVRAVDVMYTGTRDRVTGAGAVMGAVVGGVVGHQFGSGRGQDAATVAGAAAGAVAGHEMEKQRAAGSGDYYRVTIDMDRGNTESINVENPAGLRSGQRVRVVGTTIEIL